MKIHLLGRTGPRSLKGKAISSMNAVKHGAFAKTEVLPHEDVSERRRLEKAIYQALRPQDAVQESLADQMIDSLWSAERFKLRLAMRQENIFAHLTPAMLAELLEIPTEYRKFAPAYLTSPNTKIAKRDLKIPLRHYQQYQHFCKHSQGVKNYQMVFGIYQDLFQGVHDFIGKDYQVPFLLATGAGLELPWQQQPQKVEEILLKYAASLYYKLHFDELRPKIRFWMSTWFFLDRVNKQDADFQDELVLREMNRYQNLLQVYLKYQKSIEGRSFTVPKEDSKLEKG
jgi:hypothetical protein